MIFFGIYVSSRREGDVLNERRCTDAIALGCENSDRLERGWANEQVEKYDIFP